MLPRYLRFARALVLVSTALPAPVIAAELLLGGCESDGPTAGTSGGPEYGSSGTSGSPGYGTSGSPGYPAPEVQDSGEDGAADDVADAGDGGGPGGGIPELPASWGQYA